jgi:transposase
MRNAVFSIDTEARAKNDGCTYNHMARMKAPPNGARYRRSLTEKLAIVRESMKGETSVAEVARRHGVSPNVLFYWRRVYRELVGQDLTAVAQGDALADLELQVRNLERLLGQRTLEIALLRERLGIADDDSGIESSQAHPARRKA